MIGMGEFFVFRMLRSELVAPGNSRQELEIEGGFLGRGVFGKARVGSKGWITTQRLSLPKT